MRCKNCVYCNDLEKTMNGSTEIFILNCDLYGSEIMGRVTEERESNNHFCPIIGIIDEQNREIKNLKNNSDNEVKSYSLGALRNMLETCITSLTNLERATNFSFNDYEEMKISNLQLLEDNAKLKSELENCNDANACMEHDSIEYDNMGHMGFMNHVGVQSIRNYAKDRFKEYTDKRLSIPEEDLRNHYYRGLCNAYSEILEFIEGDAEPPRTIEEN